MFICFLEIRNRVIFGFYHHWFNLYLCCDGLSPPTWKKISKVQKSMNASNLLQTLRTCLQPKTPSDRHLKSQIFIERPNVFLLPLLTEKIIFLLKREYLQWRGPYLVFLFFLLGSGLSFILFRHFWKPSWFLRFPNWNLDFFSDPHPLRKYFAFF